MKNGVYYNYDGFKFNKYLLWVRDNSGWHVGLRDKSTSYNEVKNPRHRGWALTTKHRTTSDYLMPLELFTW